MLRLLYSANSSFILRKKVERMVSKRLNDVKEFESITQEKFALFLK